MRIQPTQVTIQTQVQWTVSELLYTATDDVSFPSANNKPGKLTVTFKNQPGQNRAPFSKLEAVEDEYAALGQWTDSSIQAWICTKLGLTPTE